MWKGTRNTNAKKQHKCTVVGKIVGLRLRELTPVAQISHEAGFTQPMTTGVGERVVPRLRELASRGQRE